MRFLAINQFFWPDTAATSQLLTDLCRSINPNLHNVTVVCGPAYYGRPNASISPGIDIIHVGPAAFSRDFWGRIRSYGTFFLETAVASSINRRADVVLTLTTPPLISLVGTLLKSIRGSRHFIWEMDLYPDIAVDLKVLKRGAPVTRVIGALADFSRRRADGIIALDDDMKRRLVARGIPAGKIFVAENWADGREVKPAPFKNGPLVVQYSGTLGLAHDERTVFEAIRQLRNDVRFRFTFVGGGAKRQELEQDCRREGITTVDFLDYATRPELGPSLANGHLGLVTQLPETVGSVVPSKTYGIMAAGRPVLYVGPRQSTTARMLERHECGWQVDPGDAPAMIRLLEQIESDRDLLQIAGANARSVFEKYFDRSVGTARILAILGLAQTGRSCAAPTLTVASSV